MADFIRKPKFLELVTYIFTFDDGHTIQWNITQALKYVAQLEASQAIEVPGEALRIFVANNTPDPQRYDLVDPTIPGIAAPIRTEGRIEYILIDGNHRAGRALRDGLPFRAYTLSDIASRSCILHCTNWSYVP